MSARLEADLLVLGWGKGGKALARSLGQRGRKVVLVERDEQMVGGTCINVACVPTKALVHSAEHRRAAMTRTHTWPGRSPPGTLWSSGCGPRIGRC